MAGNRQGWSEVRSGGRRGRVYVLIAAVTLLLVLHVGGQMYILSLGADIQMHRKARGEIEGEIRELELRIADLRKGERIKMIAREKLGLEFPVGPPQKLY